MWMALAASSRLIRRSCRRFSAAWALVPPGRASSPPCRTKVPRVDRRRVDRRKGLLGKLAGRMAIAYRSTTEIAAIRRAAQVVMEVLAILRDAAHPGVTTAELDALAARELARRRAMSNFKGYRPARGIPPYPG